MGKFSAAIVNALGRRRLHRFLSMPNHVRMGNYLFVHAGIHPQLGLSMLDRDWRKLPSSGADEDADPLWIRGPFLTYEGKHQEGVIVVHGHTPRDDVELLANRIGIDTRAYDSGRPHGRTADGSQRSVYTSRGQAPRVRADPHFVGIRPQNARYPSSRKSIRQAACANLCLPFIGLLRLRA